MKIRNVLVSFTAIFTLGFYGHASAHHSFAMFDQKKHLVISGVISNFSWRNPHVFISLDVTDDKGKVTRYKLECGSTSMMRRAGWKHNTVAAGDTVKVDFYPLRNGKPGGMISKIIKSDGTELTGG